jgi:phosphatidylserine decarboxylase
MNTDLPIQYNNRESGQIETETVYGEGFLRWAYGNPLGRLTVELAVKRAWFSRWYGWRMRRPATRALIAPFMRDYQVDAAEFAEPVEAYGSFNEFFYRKLKPEARPVDWGREFAVFPADGRHLAIADVDAARDFYIKGQRFDLARFLGDASLAAEFAGGAMLISRLCPVDYHRYHFPVGGEAGAPVRIAGHLRSVSPLALRGRLAILWENKRTCTLVDSLDFGKVAVVAIGATCVGSMESTYAPGPVTKGAEKGYFRFGGSCVVTLFQPGRIRFDDDLLEHAGQQREVYAKMGQRCGVVAGGS